VVVDAWWFTSSKSRDPQARVVYWPLRRKREFRTLARVPHNIRVPCWRLGGYPRFLYSDSLRRSCMQTAEQTSKAPGKMGVVSHWRREPLEVIRMASRGVFLASSPLQHKSGHLGYGDSACFICCYPPCLSKFNTERKW
jgi:hypothetical protein